MERFNIRTGLHLLRERLGPLLDTTEFFDEIMRPVLEDFKSERVPADVALSGIPIDVDFRWSSSVATVRACGITVSA